MKPLVFRPLLLAALTIAPIAQAAAQTRSITSRPMRLALLIGVDKYANNPQGLKGCGNDVTLTRSMLKSRGYGPIITLANSEATGAKIMKAVETLTRTQPQDYVYIHFSGYGNKEGSVPVICPADYKPGQGGIPYKSLLAKIDQIPALRKIAVIDCSFVKGRGTTQTTPRYWPVASRGVIGQRFTGRRSIPEEPARTMIISAAEKDAPAVESMVVAMTGGRRVWAGAMTWAYLRTASKANNNTTFQQLRGGIDARMAGRLTQTTSMRGFDLGKALQGLVKGAEKILKPAAGLLLGGATGGLSNIVTALLPNASPKTQQVAGALQTLTDKKTSTEEKIQTVLNLLNKEQPAAGRPADEPQQGAQPATITEVEGNTVTIDQGLASDVQPGTILEAPAANGGQPDQIQITTVGIDSAEGKVVQGTVEPTEQVFVTETGPPPANDPLVVEISPVDPGMDTSGINAALGTLGYVRAAGAGDISDRRLVVSGQEGALSANLVTVDIAADAAVAGAGVSGGDPASLVQALAPHLGSAFLLKKLAVIQNPASRIEMSLSVLNQNGQDASNGVQLNDTITVNVTVNRAAFITLIDVGTDGSVRVLFPNASSPSLQAQPGVPLQFPASGRIRVAPPTGKEMLVAIATARPLDVSQFDASTIPNLGVRQLSGRGVRNAANRLRNLILETSPDTTPGGSVNPSEESGWGSIFLVFPVSG